MALSVLRRYTPPTCTLEIMAKNSPLSRWVGQPVLKDLRFSLRLDDPKLTQENWISLQGDRPQLEALAEAVQNYVQNFLDQGQSGGGAMTKAAIAPPSGPAVLSEASEVTGGTVIAFPKIPGQSYGISLRPKGRLSHDLILGALGTEASGPVITLSTLQLFDLANALDEFNTDVVALPNLERPSVAKLTTAHWPKAAAAAVVAVAMSASMAKIWDTASKNGVPTSGDQRISTQLPPGSNSASPPSTSLQTLPPPPLGSNPPGANQPTVQPGQTPAVASAPGNPNVTPGTPNVAGNGNPGVIVPNQGSPEGGPPPTSGNGGNLNIAQAPGAPNTVQGRPQTTNIPGTANPALQDAPPPAAIAESGSTAAAKISTPDAARQAAPSASALQSPPQIEEARASLSSSWKPPEDLQDDAEFTVTVDSFGKVTSINPLNQAAKNTLDITGIPPRGEDFVSPLKSGESLTLRLRFKSKGGVEAFAQ